MRIRTSVLALTAATAACIAALTFAAPPTGGNVPAGSTRAAPEFQQIDTWLNSPDWPPA